MNPLNGMYTNTHMTAPDLPETEVSEYGGRLKWQMGNDHRLVLSMMQPEYLRDLADLLLALADEVDDSIARPEWAGQVPA